MHEKKITARSGLRTSDFRLDGGFPPIPAPSSGKFDSFDKDSANSGQMFRNNRGNTQRRYDSEDKGSAIVKRVRGFLPRTTRSIVGRSTAAFLIGVPTHERIKMFVSFVEEKEDAEKLTTNQESQIMPTKKKAKQRATRATRTTSHVTNATIEEQIAFLASQIALLRDQCRLPTSDFRLQTSDAGLQTSDFRLQTSDSGLQEEASHQVSDRCPLLPDRRPLLPDRRPLPAACLNRSRTFPAAVLVWERTSTRRKRRRNPGILTGRCTGLRRRWCAWRHNMLC